MIKKIISLTSSRMLLVVSALAALVICLGMPSLAVAQGSNDPSKTAACEGAGLSAGCQQTGGITVQGAVKMALNILSIVAGLVAVVMMIVGGFKYMTSQGESSQTASAKNTILYAVIGLVVAALAQIIVKFVLSRTKKA